MNRWPLPAPGVHARFGCVDRHPLDGVALRCQELVQKDAGKTLAVGDGFNIHELFGQLDGVDRHVFQHTLLLVNSE